MVSESHPLYPFVLWDGKYAIGGRPVEEHPASPKPDSYQQVCARFLDFLLRDSIDFACLGNAALENTIQRFLDQELGDLKGVPRGCRECECNFCLRVFVFRTDDVGIRAETLPSGVTVQLTSENIPTLKEALLRIHSEGGVLLKGAFIRLTDSNELQWTGKSEFCRFQVRGKATPQKVADELVSVLTKGEVRGRIWVVPVYYDSGPTLKWMRVIPSWIGPDLESKELFKRILHARLPFLNEIADDAQTELARLQEAYEQAAIPNEGLPRSETQSEAHKVAVLLARAAASAGKSESTLSAFYAGAASERLRHLESYPKTKRGYSMSDGNTDSGTPMMEIAMLRYRRWDGKWPSPNQLIKEMGLEVVGEGRQRKIRLTGNPVGIVEFEQRMKRIKAKHGK